MNLSGKWDLDKLYTSGKGGNGVLCEKCLNRSICPYYGRIRKLIREDIKLEVTVCKYYKEDPEPIVLNTLKEMEQKAVFVSKADLIKELEAKGIPKDEAEKLIKHLLMEGEIYEPKEGYLKIA